MAHFEEQHPVSEQEQRAFELLADISGKKGFLGLALLLRTVGVPETFSHGEEIALALTKDDMATVAVNRSTPFMPTRILPSILNGIPARLDFLNTILWEAQEVILVGSS